MPEPETGGSPPPLPPLPAPVPPAILASYDDAGIAALVAGLRDAESATIAAMAPHERQLKEVRARISEAATERRRRERATQIANRREVRERAASGAMPTLVDVLAGAEAATLGDGTLATTAAFLSSGGEVGFGYPTRPGSLSFTDGRQQRMATTWAEARDLYAAGWEPGTAAVTGVRVHLKGTRVERVVAADTVVISIRSGGQ